MQFDVLNWLGESSQPGQLVRASDTEATQLPLQLRQCGFSVFKPHPVVGSGGGVDATPNDSIAVLRSVQLMFKGLH